MPATIDQRRLPSTIYLYHDGAASTLDLDAIASYLHDLFPTLAVTQRIDFAVHHLRSIPDAERSQRQESLAKSLASLRIHDPAQQIDRQGQPDLLSGEIEFEARQLAAPHRTSGGVLYEGSLLAHTLALLVPHEESSLEHLHIVLTRRLFATWEQADGRYHARVILCGYPSLISTSGVVEAPARPREYYVLRRQAAAGGPSLQALIDWERTNRPRFLDHDDERLTDVILGYVMQAFMFHVSGEPFCQEPTCRLYNAHWQEDLIRAQLGAGPDFCPHHAEMIEATGTSYK